MPKRLLTSFSVAALMGASAPSASAAPPKTPGKIALAASWAADKPIDLSRLVRTRDAQAVSQAEQWVHRGALDRAWTTLATLVSPAASIVRARLLRRRGQYPQAQAQLVHAAQDPALMPLVQFETGLLASARGNLQEAVAAYEPLFVSGDPLAARVVLPYADALIATAPAALIKRYPTLEATLPNAADGGRSELLAKVAEAHQRLGNHDQAQALRRRRYLEHPTTVSDADPPPKLTPQQHLHRAEKLVKAHRNARAIEALLKISEEALAPEEVCRRRFALGLAYRKARQYQEAETQLSGVVETCADPDLTRRAMYLLAKVVSIRDGLRAIPTIERFTERFAGHSMVDDVLFWAGDMYQRRARRDEAIVFYSRIETASTKDDFCADARWRVGWMAYRAGDEGAAEQQLKRMFLDDGCVTDDHDRDRARYWMGRMVLAHDRTRGLKHLEALIEARPLSYYGQLAMHRLKQAAPQRYGAWTRRWKRMSRGGTPNLCPGGLVDRLTFQRGVEFLVRGLRRDAAWHFEQVAPEPIEVLSRDHAASQGKAAVMGLGTPASAKVTASSCHVSDASLLLTLLMDEAGAHREAHWRLRTEFSERLTRWPKPADIGLLHAAYPLAFRAELQAAEKENKLPNLLLQSLAREESAFDAEAISWAGAYGLTQLLLRNARVVAARFTPPIPLGGAESLLEPRLNARLGGNLLAAVKRRFGNHLGLTLAAYNAGDRFARSQWERATGLEFDVFAEDIGIRETRGYVRRVLRTYGVYRWLYESIPPALPVASRIPDLPR